MLGVSYAGERKSQWKPKQCSINSWSPVSLTAFSRISLELMKIINSTSRKWLTPKKNRLSPSKRKLLDSINWWKNFNLKSLSKKNWSRVCERTTLKRLIIWETHIIKGRKNSKMLYMFNSSMWLRALTRMSSKFWTWNWKIFSSSSTLNFKKGIIKFITFRKRSTNTSSCNLKVRLDLVNFIDYRMLEMSLHEILSSLYIVEPDPLKIWLGL